MPADKNHPASADFVNKLRNQCTFQISVDTDNLKQGLAVAGAALAAGIDIIEMGTPLLKFEGVHNVVPAFRKAFPKALLLADMKTMDGGAGEAEAVYAGGGNIIDFLAIAGRASAENIVAVRDQFRHADPDTPRLAFADILVPHQGPAENAVEVARDMLAAGVDGVGIHLQLDARKADPTLLEPACLGDIARAVFAAVGDKASVQVVGGLSTQAACNLAKDGLKAFVISANLGGADAKNRLALPAAEIQQHVAAFFTEVRKVST